MQPFIKYSLIASVFWGVMSTMEACAGQHRMHSALLAKFVCYGIAGVLLLLTLKGYTFLANDVKAFVTERPWFFVLFCSAVAVGSLGVYSMYCAFGQCGDNKALAVIISYCVPSVIAALLSILVLKESYNMYAGIGMLMVVAGVILIDVLGTNGSTETAP